MSEATKEKRLLYVEDDPDCLDTLSMILRERYVVFSYRSGADALAAIDDARPDLLLLDIGMQPIDGVECLRAVRGIPRWQEVPAVALTGYARRADRERLLAAGFRGVVVKPIGDFEALVAMIDSLTDPSPRLDASTSIGDLRAPRRSHEGAP